MFGFNIQRLFLICISLAALGCSSFDDFVREKSLNRARDSFVKVFVENSYDAYSCYEGETTLDNCDFFGSIYSEKITGSGFSIKSTSAGSIIMTAGHLCSASNNSKIIDFPMVTLIKGSVYVRDKNGNYIDGIILKSDPDVDLCTILLPNSAIPPTRLAKRDPKIGEKVYNLSAPLGVFSPNNIMMFEGFYTGEFPNGWSGYTIPAAPGSSGSIVINKRGEVIGIIDAVIIGFNQISLGPNRKSIISFLEE